MTKITLILSSLFIVGGLAACDKKEMTKTETESTTTTMPRDTMPMTPSAPSASEAASEPSMMVPDKKVESTTKVEKK